MVYNELIFTDDKSDNWLYKKYYVAGSNSRYWTWQLTLGILAQTRKNPLIVETGCQRQEDDLGAGMSTSILGEFVQRYGGKLITVDLFQRHLDVCRACTLEYQNVIEYVASDSLKYMSSYKGPPADMVYLDSLDYPVGENAGDIEMQKAAQEHCLKEFKFGWNSGLITEDTLVLIDDNQLPGGGKPRMLKEHLVQEGWLCLMDLQQSLWIKNA